MALSGLQDRVVLVTGAGSGIGRASALRLAREGALVALLDRDARGLDETLAALASERAIALPGDVREAEDVRRAFDAAQERFGPVRGLHDNAGVTSPSRELAEVDLEEFDRIMGINVRGCFIVLHEMLQRLRAQDAAGAIVITSSGMGVRGAVLRGLYGASKAAVASLARTAAIEEGPRGTRVNAVLPGPIDTPLLDQRREQLAASGFVERLPLARLGRAEEVAAIVAWLLSDEASYVTGALYSVDGGEGA